MENENENEEKPVSQNQDELIMIQQRKIEKEINDNIPLVSETQTIESLNLEYNVDPIYSLKTKDLASKYKGIRRTRPDGNCFFRAFAYSYLEYLINNKEDYELFRKLAQDSKDKLVKLGFPMFTLEDFHDTVSCLFFFVDFS